MVRAKQHFSTLLQVIINRVPAIFLDGKDITGAAPHVLFQKGMLRTFQLAHEFSSLTVRENLMMVPPTVWRVFD